MKSVPELNQNKLNEIFDANIEPFFRRDVDPVYLASFSLKDEQKKYIDSLMEINFAVLGIDIFQYSLFPKDKQIFVPFVFRKVYDYAIHLLMSNFSFMFQTANKDSFHERFIDRGDGGFLIQDTPLHAILFSITLDLVFRMYNSYRFTPKLRKFVGNITPRYSIAYGRIYKYNNNYYGPGIINCSRLLQIDKLNRFLIDASTFEWFMTSIAGIENLQIVTLQELGLLLEFCDYDKKYYDNGNNALIPVQHLHSHSQTTDGIKSVDVQKIGEIKAKGNDLDVYNLHLQAIITFEKMFQSPYTFTISLGNLNTSGIG